MSTAEFVDAIDDTDEIVGKVVNAANEFREHQTIVKSAVEKAKIWKLVIFLILASGFVFTISSLAVNDAREKLTVSIIVGIVIVALYWFIA